MPAGAEELARQFYGKMLQMEEVPKPPELAARGGAWFRSGKVAVHLGVDPDFRAARKAHPAFRCTAYEQTIARLRSLGVLIVPDDYLFEGKPRCYIVDPFGNRIELISE
jgi:catechol 2,3-dioxygenase-like lactoylglutathione lyase family enzyme